MTFELNVSVTDVTGAEVKPVSASFESDRAMAGVATLPQKIVLEDTPYSVTFRLEAEREFQKLEARVPVDAAYSEPTFRVTTSPGAAQIVFVLGRIKKAARKTIKDEDLNKVKDPGGPVFTPLSWEPKGEQEYYRRLHNMGAKTPRLRDPILLGAPLAANAWSDALGSASVPESKRILNLETDEVAPFEKGRFRWLEYRSEFVVAVWIPRARMRAGGRRDFVVFYTPTTAGKPERYQLSMYPYGLMGPGGKPPKPGMPPEGTNPDDIEQPFLNLPAHEYCFRRLQLVRQLIASNKRAFFVLPVNKPVEKGGWGGMDEGPGLALLLKEIAHWLRDGHLGKVAVAAFSSGSDPLVSLLRNPKGIDRHLKEVWDLDGVHPGAIEKEVTRWFRSGKDRRFRMYHSEYTAGTPERWRPADRPVFFKELGGSLLASSRPNEAEVVAGPKNQWSATYLAKEYLGIAPSSGAMPAHDRVPFYCLAHAARTSGFRDL